MGASLVVGDLRAVGDVETLWAEADKSAGRRASGRKKDAMAEFTGKRRGEMAEASFVAKVSSLGFGMAKPWGDSDPYDFIVQTGGKLWKVQVKSAHCMGEDGSYSFRAHGHSYKAYRTGEIDMLVAYVVPENAWYVFPVRVVRRLRSLKLFTGSQRRRSKFEKYREAWWILRGEDDGG